MPVSYRDLRKLFKLSGLLNSTISELCMIQVWRENQKLKAIDEDFGRPSEATSEIDDGEATLVQPKTKIEAYRLSSAECCGELGRLGCKVDA